MKQCEFASWVKVIEVCIFKHFVVQNDKFFFLSVDPRLKIFRRNGKFTLLFRNFYSGRPLPNLVANFRCYDQQHEKYHICCDVPFVVTRVVSLLKRD